MRRAACHESEAAYCNLGSLTHARTLRRYDVLEDRSATNNVVRAGDGLLDGLQLFSDVQHFASARNVHLTTACISLVLCSMQLIKNLDFHPRMGLISQTIARAAGPLSFFTVLSLSVILIYAFLGIVQYGNSMPQFETPVRPPERHRAPEIVQANPHTFLP